MQGVCLLSRLYSASLNAEDSETHDSNDSNILHSIFEDEGNVYARLREEQVSKAYTGSELQSD